MSLLILHDNDLVDGASFINPALENFKTPLNVILVCDRAVFASRQRVGLWFVLKNRLSNEEGWVPMDPQWIVP